MVVIENESMLRSQLLNGLIPLLFSSYWLLMQSSSSTANFTDRGFAQLFIVGDGLSLVVEPNFKRITRISQGRVHVGTFCQIVGSCRCWVR